MVFGEDRRQMRPEPEPPEPPEPPEHGPVQDVPLRVAAVAIGWTIALSVFAANILFPSRILSPIEHATRGLVETTWIVTGGSFLVVLAFARASGLRAQDLGLDQRACRRALLVIVATWALVQVTLVLVAGVAGEIDWGREWSLGTLFAQAFGNGLVEELVFRAMLLVAVYDALRRQGASERTALIASLVGSTIVFVLSHGPYVLATDMSVHEVSLFAVKLTAMGMVLGVLYMATKNLWLVAWVHALDNVRPDIIDVTMPIKPYGVVALVLMLVVTGVRSRSPSRHAGVHRYD